MSHSGGKIPRDRKRRLSDPAPYRKPAKGIAMPTTRHSPTRAPSSQGEPSSGDVLRELALLRKSLETRFAESAQKTDSMKEELLLKLDSNDQAVSEVQLAITDVTLSVDKNQRAIHEVRAEVERREHELPGKVRTIVQEALARLDPPSRPTLLGGQRPRPVAGLDRVEPSREDRSRTGDKKAEAYSKARRSLRLWPVSREGSLRDRTVEFLVQELLLEENYATDLQFEVRRVGNPKAGASSGVKDEVLVVFESVRDRDDVRSHARNLERRGRGVRLEVPDHLWPSFRVLQSIGFELKQKHPTMKRNVLFDDNLEDLKLDICIDGQWRTVLPTGARESLSRMAREPSTGAASISSQEIDNLWSGAPSSEDMDAQEF